MKKIHLIRHAKSSWGNELLADIDRPLNERGIYTCSAMARHIVEAGCDFSNVYCSPAARAQSTIELIALGIPEIDVKWQTDKQLYSFDSSRLYQWCRSVDTSISELVIVGHNPALTDFCNELSSGDVKNIPTCGYVQLMARGEHAWHEISELAFELTCFLRPKDLMK